MTELRLTVHGREAHSFEELLKSLGPDAFASPNYASSWDDAREHGLGDV
jgi:hypothetical protein